MALPLMAGPGAISSTIVWGTLITALAICLVSLWLLHCSLYLLGIVSHGTVAGTSFTPDRYNVITRIMGLLLMALGIEFIVLVLRGFSPACLINSFQMKRAAMLRLLRHYFYFVPAQLSKQKE